LPEPALLARSTFRSPVAKYIVRRLLYALVTVLGVSIVSFVIIQLPPGDFLESVVKQMTLTNGEVSQQQLVALRTHYGLDEPMLLQYFRWLRGIVLHWDFGQSFVWNRPVSALIAERLPLTLILALSTLLVTYAIAIPIGVYSAARQYSIGDYVATVFGFIGLAVPAFLIALVLLYVSFKYFGQSVGGLFSPNYVDAPWSRAKLVDLLSHLWIPVIIVALGGTAQLIRVMRANLLDELRKQYVVAARSRGLSERRLLVKYPTRVAISPLISTVGWQLPGLLSVGEVVAIVLSLQTTGPLLLHALQTQDMYLAGSFIFMISVLAVLGTLVADILLAAVDPRIRARYA
jgi:peptide/nickel transport system permease protein